MKWINPLASSLRSESGFFVSGKMQVNLIFPETKKPTGKPVGFYHQAIPAGFEPATHSLEGCCSIQLSYGTGFSGQ